MNRVCTGLAQVVPKPNKDSNPLIRSENISWIKSQGIWVFLTRYSMTIFIELNSFVERIKGSGNTVGRRCEIQDVLNSSIHFPDRRMLVCRLNVLQAPPWRFRTAIIQRSQQWQPHWSINISCIIYLPFLIGCRISHCPDTGKSLGQHRARLLLTFHCEDIHEGNTTMHAEFFRKV